MEIEDVGDSFDNQFFRPVDVALAMATEGRKCEVVSDRDYLRIGIGRCLNEVASGRGWIQRVRFVMRFLLRVGAYFDNLASSRRLALVREVGASVVKQLDQAAPSGQDPFDKHKELAGFGIYAADGHWHGASVHEDKVEGKKYAVGGFYAMNLRTQSMRLLDIARPKNKKEHDITALKRLESEVLRMGEPTGRKVLIAYDPAIIDYRQWFKWKMEKGIYIVTREKENSELVCCGLNDKFDRTDPRNNGVINDELVGQSNGGFIFRRITFIDPVNGKKFVFLTTEMKLQPGLIGFIYKKRWDIEKVFDEFKNKMHERKSWAKSRDAKCQQAEFMCLAHNLAVITERRLEEEERIIDETNTKRKAKRLEVAQKTPQEAGRSDNPLNSAAYKAVQRTLQFFRWVECALISRASWRCAVELYRPIAKQYLQ